MKTTSRTTKLFALAAMALLAMTGISSAQSSNADLSSLVPSDGTLTPNFASGTTAYTAIVPNATSSITVTPTAADANATITVNGDPVVSGDPSGAISLNLGSNVITTEVTAEDAVTIKTYTLTVTRAHNTALIYEAFHDLNSTLTGNASGIGLSGTWSGSSAILGTTLDFGDLPAGSGGMVSSSNQNGYVSVGTTLSGAGLLDDGKSLWFSVIAQSGSDVGTNGDFGFVLGTDQINAGNNIGISNGGNALGVRLKNNQMRAAFWSPGLLQSTGTGAANNTKFLIVGKYTWGAETDKVEIFNVATDLTMTPASTYTTDVNVDQSLFDTVSFGNKSANPTHRIDEFRFAATAADVLPRSGDVTAPSLVSTDVANLGTGNAYILTATFDELVAPGTGNIRIYNVNDTLTAYTTIAATDTTQVSADAKDFRIKPNLVLEPGETYYVEIDSGVVRDGMGNAYAGFTGDSTWKFTQESTAPTLADTDIVSRIYGGGSTYLEDHPFSYTVTFSEPMDPATVNIGDFDNNDATSLTINSVTPRAPSFPMGDATDTFTVSVTANDPGTVTLRVPTGATLNDSVGNAMTALPVVDVETITIIAHPATVLFDSTAATGLNGDKWNQPTNWDPEIVPFGTLGAIVDTGLTAVAAISTTPSYSGGLTLGTGSILRVSDVSGAQNAVGTGTITMNGGTIDLQCAFGVNLPAINLTGNGTVTASSNAADADPRDFTGAITGNGVLTLQGRNTSTVDFQVANNFSGGLNLEAIDRYRVRFQAAGSAGTGDVTVTPRTADARGAIVTLEASNVFADTATLTLNSNGNNGTSWPSASYNGKLLEMGAGITDTVAALVVQTVTQPSGTYGRVGNLTVDNQVAWFIGDGVLTVDGGSDTTDPTLTSITADQAGPINVNTMVTFTVTFDEDMDASTVTSDDFGNAGSSLITIGAITETTPGVYTVQVTPTTAGTLQLQINAGAVLSDAAVPANNLDTTNALTGGGPVITVNAPDPYADWADGAAFGADKNSDGVSNGLAFLLGAANPDANALAMIPEVREENGNLIMEFDCLATADRGDAVLSLQYSNDLGNIDPWTTVAVPGVVGNTTNGSVSFVATAIGDLIHIVATINASEAAGGKLFGRLQATE